MHKNKMNKTQAFLEWHTHTDVICKKIRDNPSNFKVILKTKNEFHLLKKWLNHYQQFLTSSEIIIADNFSDDSAVGAIYECLDDNVTIFKYSSNPTNGAHNCIHDAGQFPELYDALKNSCDHFLFADTDEFLVLHNETNWSINRELLLTTLSQLGDKGVCTSWFETIPLSDKSIYLGKERIRLVNFLAWGKPILPSHTSHTGFKIHNVQFSPEIFCKSERNFLLLHLKNFIPAQRLAANKQKLIARNLVTAGASYTDIINFNFEHTGDPTAVRLAAEIKEILSRSPEQFITKTPEDCITLEPAQSFSYTSDIAQQLFSEYNSHYLDIQREAFALYRQYR